MCYLSQARWRGVLLSIGMLLALTLSVGHLHAQSRNLIVQVLDERTEEPLAGAVAHLGRHSMQTDSWSKQMTACTSTSSVITKASSR